MGIWGWGGGEGRGGDGARVSIFLLTKNPIFYGRGWGTVTDFFKKNNSNLKIFFRGKGVRDATVSDFFYKESKSKKIKKFVFLCWWVGG